uniref:AAA-ATPase-like domain-containing protein n=1 Tax=Ditylenchus dipsaci TaxID=166011 RepID=A0A915CPJ6_9BILA
MLTWNRSKAKQSDELVLNQEEKLPQHFDQLSVDVKLHKPKQVLVKDYVAIKQIKYNASAYSSLLTSSTILDRSLFVTSLMTSNNRFTVLNMPPRTGKTMLLELSKHILSVPNSYIEKRLSNYKLFNNLCRSTRAKMAEAKDSVYEGIYRRIDQTLTAIRESQPEAKSQAEKYMEQCRSYLEMMTSKGVEEQMRKDDANDLFCEVYTHLDRLIEDSKEAKFGSQNLPKHVAVYSKDELYRGGFEKFIAEDDPRFSEFFGMRPVIHISFLSSGKDTFSSVFSAVRHCVQAAYQEHAYLKESLMFRGDEQSMKNLEKFKKYLNSPEDLTEREFQMSLTFLSNLLHEEFKRTVVVLVDEYDSSFNAIVSRFPGTTEACEDCQPPKQCHCFQRVNQIMKEFYTTLKENKAVEKVLMVGILPTRVFISALRADENTVVNNRYSHFFMISEKEFVFLCLYFEKTTEEIQGLHKKYQYFLHNKFDNRDHQLYAFPALIELCDAHLGDAGVTEQGTAQISSDDSQTLGLSDMACQNINRFLLNVGYLSSSKTIPGQFAVPNGEIRQNILTLLDSFFITKCQRQMSVFMD